MSQFCTEKGGWLAEIFSSEEQTSIMNEVPLEQDSHYWIGLTDSAVEGHFIWQHSSKPLSWLNWNGGEPNNGSNDHDGNENCVILLKNGKWNDSACGRDYSYYGDIHALCEYRL